MESEDFETKVDEDVDEQPIEYECPKCGKTYKRESALVTHVTTCEGAPEDVIPEFEPTDCPKCGKTYKRQAAYEKHVESCTGPVVKAERVPMTDEEKAAKRKEYVQRWVDKNITIQIRLLKDSDDLAFVEAQVELLQETDENAGMATYFRELLAKAKKNAIKRGAWERVDD
jgi:uncharacterized C2H2 Zn-finger protein